MNLPDGWTKVPLENVVDILDSQRVPLNSDERERRINGKSADQLYPYFGATGQVGYVDDFLFDESLVLLGEDGVPFFDPLRHKAYRVEGKCWVNNHAHVLRAKHNVTNNRYISSYLNTFNYTGFVAGTTRLKLTQASMRAIPVLLAPLNEQKRIADKLDALLAKVEACRERLDRVPLVLKRFRQAVLSAATSGQLTEDWREKNAACVGANGVRPGATSKNGVDGKKGACHAPLQDRGEGEELPEIPESWQFISFSKLIADGPKNGLYKHSTSYGTGTRILRIDMFYDGEILPWERMKRLTLSEAEGNEFDLAVGDIVINRVNSPPFVGKSAIIRDLPESCVFESNMMRIRLDQSQISPEYCIRFLNSHQGLTQLRLNVKHAVNQSSINQQDVKAVIYSLPPLPEQQEIVRRVATLFTFADRLEARYAAARRQVDQLTPSLLAKAFRGELVPQDPNDEPAEKLLERIKSTVTSSGKTATIRKN